MHRSEHGGNIIYFSILASSTKALFLFVSSPPHVCTDRMSFQVSEMLRHTSMSSVAGLLSNLRSHGVFYTIQFMLNRTVFVSDWPCEETNCCLSYSEMLTVSFLLLNIVE